VLFDPSCLGDVIGLVAPPDFDDPRLGHIYAAILEVTSNGQPLDIGGIGGRLREAGALKAVGGMPYLAQLQDAAVTSAAIRHHAEVIGRYADARRALSRVTSLCQDTITRGTIDGDFFEELSSTTQGLRRGGGESSFKAVEHSIPEATSALAALLKARGKPVGLSTGLVGLDNLLGGFHASDLIILAARPSMGKTALGLAIASFIAARGKPVGFFSLEMSSAQIAQRLICYYAGLSLDRLRAGKLTSLEVDRIRTAVEVLGGRKFFVDEGSGLSVGEVCARARRMADKHGIEFIVVDYLQLMSGSGQDNREQEIAHISRQLKAIAKELAIPVLAMSQLNRGVEHRADRRPMLADLRESGAIEQDADVVSFIYRDDQYNPDSDDASIAEVIVAKHRHGATGTVKLVFDGSTGRFGNIYGDAYPVISDTVE
jgi:replicative DNA helicase